METPPPTITKHPVAKKSTMYLQNNEVLPYIKKLES